MSQYLESQPLKSDYPHSAHSTAKPTQSTGSRVGEDWPPLLSKKWLAIYFGCWTNKGVCSKRLRSKVLTPEVLSEAGIPEDVGYSRNTRSFNAIQSMRLTQILRGFCLIALLFCASISTAQNSVKYSGDTFVRDTFPGIAVISDSTIRMIVYGTGFRYEKVLSSIVIDAYMVKEYRYLVRATDGGTEPFDLTQTFHLLTGGIIDPRRILIFKQHGK